MTATAPFAIKLHIHQLLDAEASGSGSNAELHLYKASFQRVWLQGEVLQKDESTLVLADAATEGRRSVVVKRTSAVVEMWEGAVVGAIIMIIGKLTIKKGMRMVSAHKVRVLEDAEQRLVMWVKELQELHSLVYPALQLPANEAAGA